MTTKVLLLLLAVANACRPNLLFSSFTRNFREVSAPMFRTLAAPWPRAVNFANNRRARTHKLRSSRRRPTRSTKPSGPMYSPTLVLLGSLFLFTRERLLGRPTILLISQPLMLYCASSPGSKALYLLMAVTSAAFGKIAETE